MSSSIDGGRTSSTDGPSSLSLKLVLLGDTGVGKSQLASRFTKGTFKEKSERTNGLEYSSRTLQIFGINCKVQLWDCAGIQCPEKMSKAFFKGAIGAIVCYDIQNRESFNNVQRVWLKQLQAFGRDDMKTLLIANKMDLGAGAGAVNGEKDRDDDRSVSAFEGQTLTQVLGMPFAECSAKTGSNVDNAVKWLVYELVRNTTEVADLMSEAGLPNGWIATKALRTPEGGLMPDQSYENWFTGEVSTDAPGSAGHRSSVRVPATAVRKVEPVLTSRASFSAMAVDLECKKSSLHDYIPKCCQIS
jgi:small GTP-binding protein